MTPFTASRKNVERPSGALGAHFCHASTTAVKSFHCQVTLHNPTNPIGCTLKSNDVTMPKLPPPPPRHAQYKSAFSFAFARTYSPFAFTSRTPAMLSQVSPYLRDVTPKPPPSASPAMPTLKPLAAGTVSPTSKRFSWRSRQNTPAPTRATLACASTLISSISLTSTITPPSTSEYTS